MELLKSIFGWNYILSVSVISWFVAQTLKTFINFAMIGTFDVERMWGAGGMPSCHSATVCAMAVATGRYAGVHSPLFAIAAIVAIIVMYDAMGVRRETGEQAKILNKMLEEWAEWGAKTTTFLNEKKLKEMVGHTPIEVISGAALGIVMGLVIPPV